MLRTGTIVFSLAGRDKGEALAVIGFSEKGVLLSNGRDRPLSRPKCKNPKHVKKTHFSLTADEMATDLRLRRALRQHKLNQERG